MAFSTENVMVQLPEYIKRALEESLKAEYDEISKKLVEDFKQQIDRRRDEVVAGVLLNVTHSMSMRDMSDRLVVEIMKPDMKQV